MRVTSGIVSTLQQKTTTGFAPNDRGVASDDLVVDNPMSGRADCTNVGISGHCGLLQCPHQGVSGNDTLAKLRPVFVLHVTRNCSVSPLFVFNNCCQIDGARAVPWGQANTNGANRRFLETESPSSD